MPSRTLLPALALVIAAGPALVSCSSQEPPDATVDRLAEALTEGSLPAELFTAGTGNGAEDPQAAYTEALGSLLDEDAAEEVTVDVEAGDITEPGGDGEDTAEAELDWAWRVAGHEWTYTTTATLEYAAETWRVRWSPELLEPSLRPGETLGTVRLTAERGRVLAGDGSALVTDRPVVRLGLDKTRVKGSKVASSARRIATQLDIAVAPYVRAAKAAGERAFVEALVLRRGDTGRVTPAFGDIPGAVALDDRIPLAPTREFAAPILGRVGEATAEVIESSEGAVRIGDVVGLSGLQARYDEQLRGTPGLEVRARNDKGRTRALFTVDPAPGEDLRLTLDTALQTRAERILEPLTGPASAIVALRPSTGEVLAAANGPGNGGQNLATYGRFAPGSTFKIVSTLALLRSGLDARSPVTCPAEVVVDGKTFTNYDGYPTAFLGRVPLRTAFAQSCNTAFIGARGRLDDGDLAAAAEALGLGVDHDIGFPAYFGQVPAPESATEAAADLIGQGRVLASPLVMASVVASVQTGRTVVPWLVEGQRSKADPRRPLTGTEARALRELMRAVVTEGSGRVLSGVPGGVGAKTGTAEYGDPGPGGALRTHAWMVAGRDDLAVAVFVETGDSGSGTAGPLLAQLLR